MAMPTAAAGVVRRLRAVPMRAWAGWDGVELLVVVSQTADLLALDLDGALLGACGSTPDARGVGVVAGAHELELPVREALPFEPVDAEVWHHRLALTVVPGGDHLLALGVRELVEEDAVGRLGSHTRARPRGRCHFGEVAGVELNGSVPAVVHEGLGSAAQPGHGAQADIRPATR